MYGGDDLDDLIQHTSLQVKVRVCVHVFVFVRVCVHAYVRVF